MLLSYQSAKVFSLENFLLYGIMCACVVGGGMGTCALVCTRVVDGCAHVFIVQGVFVDVLSNNVYVRRAHAENVNMEE